VRGDWARRIDDSFQNSVHVSEHIAIPETQYQISARFEVGCPPRIIHPAFRMLSSIQFDDQSRRFAAEIDDVIADRHLPAELQSMQTSVAKPKPQRTFSVGLIAPQPSRR
jgi:hypothetical protein